MSTFHNQTAVVTGGASGSGQALCEELAHRGSSVVVANIDLRRTQDLASSIASQRGRAESAEVHVAGAKEMERLVEDTVSHPYGA